MVVNERQIRRKILRKQTMIVHFSALQLLTDHHESEVETFFNCFTVHLIGEITKSQTSVLLRLLDGRNGTDDNIHRGTGSSNNEHQMTNVLK